MKPNYSCCRTHAATAFRYKHLYKKITAFCMGVCSILSIQAQTLFTYGDQKIDAKEFKQAYQKNTNAISFDKQSINEYLQLYINSKLKILEAYNRGYDTLPQQKEEFANLRSQIIDNYLNDPQTLNKLVMEAFDRSQKEIDVAHIFIRFNEKNGEPDTSVAFKKINDAYQEIKNGTSFSDVALRYSQDPSVTTNMGTIGYVTVFNLPYAFENIVYQLEPGQVSAPFRSKNGYHIFKNKSERKALGHINAWQVLIALPPNADPATKNKAARLADSLYNRLLAGDDKEKIASTFSNDFISAQAGGMMPSFSVGQYDPAFENMVASLPLNSFSKPFETGYGFHIVNKISVTPIVSDPNDTENLLDLKTRVNQSDRIEILKQVIYDKVAQKAGFTMMPGAKTEWLWITDSILDNRKSAASISIQRESPLFTVGPEVYTIQNWLDYAQLHRYKPGTSSLRPYAEILEEYKMVLANNYYRDHLEDFNPGFASQLNDFKEGNMFFEIMQHEIWNRAQEDSVGLKNYYEQNHAKYNWENSADAIIFYCTDEAIAYSLKQDLTKDPGQWKEIINHFGEKVITDSARYELAQIPGADTNPLANGMITKTIMNDNDQSASFAYIIKTYPQPEQRTFAESRGFVLNDYQQHLETQWLANLRKKYPVKIKKKTLKALYKK